MKRMLTYAKNAINQEQIYANVYKFAIHNYYIQLITTSKQNHTLNNTLSRLFYQYLVLRKVLDLQESKLQKKKKKELNIV